jgi:hypothetical protein
MENSHGKAMIAGILSIVSGVIGILYGVFILAFWIFFLRIMSSESLIQGAQPVPDDIFTLMLILYSVISAVIIILGVLGIIGGVFALKRKYWGWALAGAIASTITFFPCGIAAIIMVSLGQSEFSVPISPETRY